LDRNLLIAFVLSFVVLYSWSAWQESMRPPEPPQSGIAAPEAGQPDTRVPSGQNPPEQSRYADLPDGSPDASPQSIDLRSSPVEPVELELGDPGEQIRVERPLFEAVLNTRGAALESWRLREYTDEYGDPVTLVEGGAGAGAAAVTPFVELDRGDLSRVDWRVASQDSNEIVFALERDGVRLRKTWSFEDEGYGFRLRLDVENGSSAPVSPRFLVDWAARVRPEQDFVEQAVAVLHAGEMESNLLSGLGSGGFLGLGGGPQDRYDYLREVDWAGVQTTYFLSALLPDNPSQASARVAVIERSQRGAVGLFFDPVDLPPGQTLTREFRGYVGPKELPRLEAIGSGLDRAVDLGWAWFAPLTRGFGWLLQAIYSFIPNYGLAIIVLTFLVRVVTAPLTVKQMKSMERMRRVQPRMKEIQEKYSDDRQKQSEAMMSLYRTEKVNPLGGCFPMLLQLPVFIGLFYALRSSISLRQAPFFGWIDDLSAPESLFTLPGIELPVRVLPLIMGATMFLQQKITPMQTPDPAQARMMLTIMPLMMTVLFYQFASGLVLYWMMSNVLAILHQLWIGRNLGPMPAAESESPAPKAA
jgi:YidC/Oxa1 family membrane protein insertase